MELTKEKDGTFTISKLNDCELKVLGAAAGNYEDDLYTTKDILDDIETPPKTLAQLETAALCCRYMVRFSRENS